MSDADNASSTSVRKIPKEDYGKDDRAKLEKLCNRAKSLRGKPKFQEL